MTRKISETRRKPAPLPVLISAVLLAIGLGYAVADASPYLLDDALKKCPETAAQEQYQAVLTKYGYRMRGLYEAQGCGIIPLYYAFENAEVFMDQLEMAENAELARGLSAALKKSPALETVLHDNAKLTLGLGIHLADESEAASQAFLPTLASLEKLGERDAPYAALMLLVPGAPPLADLKESLTPQEASLMLEVLRWSALGSDGEYKTFLSDTPRDTLETYRMFIKAWPEPDLLRVLRRTPEAIIALTPPMRWSELSELVPASRYSPSSFKALKKAYVEVQRNLFLKVERAWGADWAAEAASAFSDALAMNLLDASPKKARAIESFLAWLMIESRVFPDLLKPTACDEVNNLQLLAFLLTNAGADFLGELAQWRQDGRLGDLLDHWAQRSSPVNFKLVKLAFPLNENKPEEVSDNKDGKAPVKEDGETLNPNEDLHFWGALISLAHLSRDNQELLDYLIYELRGPDDPLWIPMVFMAQVAKKTGFFSIMETRRFQRPKEVALRLLDYGYPNSNDRSLWECFSQQRSEGCADLAAAVSERGRLPEDEIMKAGRTFKDRTGVDRETAIELAFLAADILATVFSGGTSSPATGTHAALVSARLLTRLGMRQMARETIFLSARVGWKEAGRLGRDYTPKAASGGKIPQSIKRRFLFADDVASKIHLANAISCAAVGVGVCGPLISYEGLEANYNYLCPEKAS